MTKSNLFKQAHAAARALMAQGAGDYRIAFSIALKVAWANQETTMTTLEKYNAYQATHNEGAEGFNPYAAQLEAEAQAKAAARIDHIVANADEYRAKWNAAVQKYSRNGRMDMTDLPKIEAEAGVSINEMKLAKARMARAA